MCFSPFGGVTQFIITIDIFSQTTGVHFAVKAVVQGCSIWEEPSVRYDPSRSFSSVDPPGHGFTREHVQVALHPKAGVTTTRPEASF